MKNPALAAAESQTYEKNAAGAKAQGAFAALLARLKSCPDAFRSLNGILQEVRMFDDPSDHSQSETDLQRLVDARHGFV
jgi:hypothetical protein